jgi:hypothetical protein
MKKEIEDLDKGGDSREKERRRGIIEVEEKSLERDVIWCKWLLLTSSICLVVGAFCVAAAFAAILF